MLQVLDLESNRIRMRMVDSGGPGRAIVFIHGLGWDHRLWERAFAIYAAGYRVIAGDTRGHGASDKPAGPYSIRQFADDWRGALDALGVGRACIVGFSQGGMIAQQLAIDEPGRFDRLVLASTTSQASEQAQVKIEERIRKIESGDTLGAAKLAVASIFSNRFAAAHPDLIDKVVATRAAASVEPLIAVMRAGRGFDVRDKLTTMEIPVLVISGSEDGLIPCAVTERLVDQLPRARFVRIEGAGHMLPVEEPESFYGLVSDYLREHYPAGVPVSVGASTR